MKNPSQSLSVTSLKDDYYEALDWWDHSFQIPYDSKDYRIVFHSLEDLSVPIKIHGGKIVVSDLICQIVWENTNGLKMESDPAWIVNRLVAYFANSVFCPFPRDIMNQVYYILHTLHFDMSGFIDRKEAINAKTLKVDPYEFEKIVF